VVVVVVAVLLITVNTRDLQQKQGLRKELEKPKKRQKFQEEQYNSKKKKEEEEETPAPPHLLLILRELAALCLESKNGPINIRDLRLLREDVPHACGVLSPLRSSQQNYDIRKNRHKSRLTRIIRNRSQKNRKRNLIASLLISLFSLSLSHTRLLVLVVLVRFFVVFLLHLILSDHGFAVASRRTLMYVATVTDARKKIVLPDSNFLPTDFIVVS
jgi:hypothetical protein